jgi:SPX domain protein involved in polyphosphate accumulation
MRYERKYRIEDWDWRHVLQIVRQHPLSFRTAYPDRQVNNIYLDTPDLSDFQENLMGISRRSKYRIRWYGGDLHRVEKPVMEIKSKDAGLGDKHFFKMTDFQWHQPHELRKAVDLQLKSLRKESMERLAAGIEEENPGIFPVQGLHPSLINTYLRSYFVSQDGRYRLTIDHDLLFYSPDTRARKGLDSNRDDAVILEIKYESDQDDNFDEVGRFLPFQLSRNSKYVTGILLTQP